jgi:glutamate transport system permease protein
MNAITDNWGVFGDAFLRSLGICVWALVGALAIGTLVAAARVSPVAPLRGFGSTYVTLIRNCPLTVVLFFIAFGLPEIGVNQSYYFFGVSALAIYTAAFVCEALRAGINSVSAGQAEAARAIGMTFGQSLSTVILPQALRTMVQPLVNIFIGVALGSSMAAAVAVPELTYTAQQIGNETAESMLLFVISAAVYIVIALLGGATGSVLERRLRVQR